MQGDQPEELRQPVVVQRWRLTRRPIWWYLVFLIGLIVVFIVGAIGIFLTHKF